MEFRAAGRSIDEIEGGQPPQEFLVGAKVADVLRQAGIGGVAVNKSHQRREQETVLGMGQKDGKAVDEVALGAAVRPYAFVNPAGENAQ